MPQNRTETDAQDLFERGFKNFESGEYREAVECFTRAIRLRPDVSAGYRYRALAYLELGQRTDALNDLDQAIRRKSDDPLLYADRARILLRQKAYDAAIADCDKALALDPGLISIVGLRGDCHAGRGSTEKAFADYATAIAGDPDNAAEYLLARAHLRLDLEDNDGCIEDCSAALLKNPNLVAAYQTRGLARRDTGDLEGAESDLSEAVKLSPEAPLPRLARATARLGRHQYAEAATDCDEVIRLAPAVSKGYEIRGMCRKQLGDLEGAAADYTQAIQLTPTNPLAYNLRAGVHYARKQYKAAVQDHLDALKKDPQSAATFNQLGWVWATAPDPDVRNGARAKECATRACELTEWQEPGYLDTLAAASAECGDFDAAVKWQEKALAMAKPEAEDEYRTRLALYRDGKPARVTPGP